MVRLNFGKVPSIKVVVAVNKIRWFVSNEPLVRVKDLQLGQNFVVVPVRKTNKLNIEALFSTHGQQKLCDIRVDSAHLTVFA